MQDAGRVSSATMGVSDEGSVLQVVTVSDRNVVSESVPLPTESLLPYPSAMLHPECVEAVGAPC